METLVIYTDPHRKGYNNAVLAELTKQLNAQQKEFEVIDLYKLKYDPVLHENELYTAGKTSVSKQNKAFQKKIEQANNLIFIYPMWWYTTPAILKGFIDKVFTEQYAYHFDEHHMPHGHLSGKKAVQFVTTGGPFLYYLLLRKTKGLTIIKETLGLCGIKMKTKLLGGCAEPLNEKKQQTIEKNVRKGIAFLH